MAADEGWGPGEGAPTDRRESSQAPPDEDLDARWWPDEKLGERFRRWTTPPSNVHVNPSVVPEVLVERLAANGIDAVGTAPKRSMPPIAPPGLSQRIAKMVDRLAEHGPNEQAPDQAALLRIGEEALPILCARFPGRLWFSRWQAHTRPPPGRDVSGLCRTLVAFGERAVPYVADLLEAEDADTRYYATLVAIELSHPAFLRGLARLLFDTDHVTAKLALQMLTDSARFEGYEDLVTGLRSTATSADADERSKLLAIRALAVIRDQSAVQPLITLLSGRGVLSEAASQVLRMLTLQDFGPDQARWQAWYAAHGREARQLWLGRGLEHGNPDIREIARRDLYAQQRAGQSSS